MAIGARIRNLREKRGLAAAELARQLNVSRAAVTQWEKGRCPPRQNLLQPLADALLTHAGYILTGDGDPRRIPSGQLEIPERALYVINKARAQVAEALGVPTASVRIQVVVPVPFFGFEMINPRARG